VDVQKQLTEYAKWVDLRLEQLLPSIVQQPRELHEAMRYSCLAPGKRIRPALCLASAAAVGATEDVALDGACAIEMVHCFSLIHDDLPSIDDDDLRRGVPTCHKVFGEAVAILAGDALFALAFDVLARVAAPAERVVQAIATLTRATGSDGLVGGETTDVLCEGKSMDAETLRFIHSKKTGSLIAASCQIGGILGGGEPDAIARLGRYGEAVGLAFQITDDVLNETSTREQLGKSAGSDRERGKVTYPSLYGLEASKVMARETLERALAELSGLESPMLKGIAGFSIERVR
jgi:geranylgeranyl diphosphate synthase type II